MRLCRIYYGDNTVCHSTASNWGYGYYNGQSYQLYQRPGLHTYKMMVKMNLSETKKPIFIQFPNGRKIIIWQEGRKTFMNGFRVLKNNIPNYLMTIFVIARKYETDEEFENYLHRLLTADPVVSKAITDKVLYTFYKDDGTEVETLLSINLIGDNEIAIELNPGTWVPLTVPKFKSFYNAAQGRKNKFSHISPEELYHVCTRKILSEGDRRMTHAFLEQNRKSALREKRSLELIQDLQTRFKGIEAYEVDISSSNTQNYLSRDTQSTDIRDAMFVEGKQLNWCVLNRNLKTTGQQDVSTFMVSRIDKKDVIVKKDDAWVNGVCPTLMLNGREIYLQNRSGGYTNADFLKAKNSNGETVVYYLYGPICIDNAETDVSIGDQFAGRALALLNDTHAMVNVSTLASFRNQHRKEGDTIHGLSELQIIGSEELSKHFGV